MAVACSPGRPRSRRSAACRRVEQRRQAGIGAAVVGDLEHVDGLQRQRRASRRSRRRRRAASRSRPASQPRDERVVVRVARAARQPGGARGRPQDLEAQAAERDHLARPRATCGSALARARSAARAGPASQPAPPSTTSRGAYARDHRRPRAVVVRLPVGHDERVELAHPRLPAAASPPGCPAAPASTRTAARAVLDEHGVPLADLQERHDDRARAGRRRSRAPGSDDRGHEERRPRAATTAQRRFAGRGRASLVLDRGTRDARARATARRYERHRPAIAGGDARQIDGRRAARRGHLPRPYRDSRAVVAARNARGARERLVES